MHSRRRVVILGGLLAVVAVACATRDSFRLIHPPTERNDRFPGGHRLLLSAPLADWHVEARFASREACEQARLAATETAVTQARATLGDAAKNDLGLRRAVHARCVRASRVAAPES